MITGKQISAARKSLGMTQAKLADKLGVSTEAVSKWEKDVYAPSAENEEKIYRVLGIARAGDNRRDVVLFHERNMSAFLKGKFNSGEYPQALKALSFAKKMHDGQYRKPKDLKIPYINHPLTMACHALAMGLEDDALLAAVLLHDVCEDCGVEPSELPVDPDVQHVVALVTKSAHGFNERAYYNAISENPMAAMVKCLDRCNNLSGMAAGFSVERMRDYIEETERYYPTLLDVIKDQPEYNNAAWLLSYQMRSLVLATKRITI